MIFTFVWGDNVIAWNSKIHRLHSKCIEILSKTIWIMSRSEFEIRDTSFDAIWTRKYVHGGKKKKLSVISWDLDSIEDNALIIAPFRREEIPTSSSWAFHTIIRSTVIEEVNCSEFQTKQFTIFQSPAACSYIKSCQFWKLTDTDRVCKRRFWEWRLILHQSAKMTRRKDSKQSAKTSRLSRNVLLISTLGSPLHTH